MEKSSPETHPTPSHSNHDTQKKLVDLPINTENDALNAMVQFLNTAQRRGAFAFDESAKIYECFKKFQ
jgi:hypothetical protein